MKIFNYQLIIFLVFSLISQLTWSKENLNHQNNLSNVERATFKTVTFQTAANLSDALIFGTFVGASTTTSALFFFANTASAMAVYFPYELIWNALSPAPETATENIIAIKTATYQFISGIRNLALSYAFSGTLWASAGFTTTAIAVDSLIYVANEYFWDILSPRVVNKEKNE